MNSNLRPQFGTLVLRQLSGLLQLLHQLHRHFFVRVLHNRLVNALAFENQSQKLDLSQQDSAVSQRSHAQLFEVFVVEHEQGVALDFVGFEIFNAVSKSDLVEPTSNLSNSPLMNYL